MAPAIISEIQNRGDDLITVSRVDDFKKENRFNATYLTWLRLRGINYDFYEKWAVFSFVPLLIVAVFAAAVFIREDRRKGMVILAMSVMYIYCLN